MQDYSKFESMNGVKEHGAFHVSKFRFRYLNEHFSLRTVLYGESISFKFAHYPHPLPPPSKPSFIII